MNIVLIGFKNSGKTSVGKLIAEKTKKLFIDTDYLIEKQYYVEKNAALTVREICQSEGEAFFRRLEAETIKKLSDTDNNIISTGGGSILESNNVSYLKKHGKLIYLSASFQTLLVRLQSQPVPTFLDAEQPEKSFRDLYQQRENIYKQMADVEIMTEKKSITDIAEEIIFLTRPL